MAVILKFIHGNFGAGKIYLEITVMLSDFINHAFDGHAGAHRHIVLKNINRAHVGRFYGFQFISVQKALKDFLETSFKIQILGNFDLQFTFCPAASAEITEIQEQTDQRNDECNSCSNTEITHATCQADGHGEEDDRYVLAASRSGTEPDETEGTCHGHTVANVSVHEDDHNRHDRGEHHEGYGKASGTPVLHHKEAGDKETADESGQNR